MALVVDITMRGSFGNSPEEDEELLFYSSHYKYLETITTRPIEIFIAGKPREGTRYTHSFSGHFLIVKMRGREI